MKKKEILIFSGPSGVGKTALWQELEKVTTLNLEKVITTTTRSPRPGEEEGIHYHFLTRSEFMQGIDAGNFIEHAEVHGNLYGSTYSEIERIFALGRKAVFIIDPQGAKHFCEHLSLQYAVSTFFILPPSLEELERRLRGRWTESSEAFALRLSNAVGELQAQSWFDYKIVNDALEHAVSKIQSILESHSPE